METIDKTKITNLISEKSDFIIQFSASWCGPCRALTPILENVGYSNDVNVYKFDIGLHWCYKGLHWCYKVFIVFIGAL